MPRLLRWDLKRLTETIVLMLLNKFDAIICLEGSRGIGKSTLAIVLARRTSSVFTRLKKLNESTVMYYWEKVNKQIFPTFEIFIKKLLELKKENAYSYRVKRDTIYTREKIIKFFDKWHRIAVADELVMACFSRDFYTEEQKDLIKIINTNRDHANLLLGCVPSFNTLDIQIKGLTKIRISIIRRGLALIHTPNRSLYSRDRWDSQFNEKLEREWLKKKIRKPQYAKFTTIRGMIRFSDLPDSVKKVYEEVKKNERNIIAKEEFGLSEENKMTPAQKMAKKLLEDGVKNSAVLHGYAMANNIDPTSFTHSVRREIAKQGKNPSLVEYYWDEQGKKRKKAKIEAKQDVQIALARQKFLNQVSP